MKKFLQMIILLLLAILTVSCAAPVVTLKSSFDKKEAEYIFKEGNANISGQAFLRTRGGDVKTCAGRTIFLVPYTSYAAERFYHIKELSDRRGKFTGFYASNVKFEPENPEYHSYVRKTVCDASGNFAFERIHPGKYFIEALIYWEVPFGYSTLVTKPEGGIIVEEIEVKDGETKKIVITR